MSEALQGHPAATRVASLAFAANGAEQLSNGVLLGQTSIVRCVAVRVCGGFRLVYGNWSKAGEREPSNSIKLQAGLERADKTIFPVSWLGQESVTIGRGGLVISDLIPFEAEQGTVFYVRTYVSVEKEGEKWPLDVTTVSENGEGATTTNQNKAHAEAITPSNGVVYSPVGIVAVSPTESVKVIAQIGDSIISGMQDTPVDLGWFNRALNAKWAYVNVAKGGDTAKKWSEGTTSESRMKLIDAATHAVVAYGINDLNEGRTAALIKENLLTIYNRLQLRGIKVYGVTITPKSTSTDGFKTVEHQTVGSHNAATQEINEWLRGLPAPLSNIIDAAHAVESSAGSGLWKAEYTEEGTHPLAIGHKAIAESFSPATLFT